MPMNISRVNLVPYMPDDTSVYVTYNGGIYIGCRGLAFDWGNNHIKFKVDTDIRLMGTR